MKKISLPILLGYVVGSVSLLLGLSIILNLWDFPVPATTRNIFGAILILLGIYRFSVTSLQKRNERRRFDED